MKAPIKNYLCAALVIISIWSCGNKPSKDQKAKNQVMMDQNPPLTVRIKASNGMYLSLRKTDNKLLPNQSERSNGTWFELVELGNGNLAFKASTGKYLTIKGPPPWTITVDGDQPTGDQTFMLTTLGKNKVQIKTANGCYLQADKAETPLSASPKPAEKAGEFTIEVNR